MADDPILSDIKKAIHDNTIVLFCKGTKDMPRCGFSARTIQIFKEVGKPFEVVDILPDPRIRMTLSGYSNWPTIPQVFIAGQFVGGADIVGEMYQDGELQKVVDKAFTK
ncbi:MAG TPA: Grx4 family monothiol glutaredoxin [Candidatus Polarisedimenticolia bacterium]|nr:Grx4 family monothiol glutaredoxin [Candidatus Polarisedimenticolia bacterium]